MEPQELTFHVFMVTAAGVLRAVEQLIGISPEILRSVDPDGNSLLHCAAANGHADIVDYYLEQGLSINGATPKGVSPLFLAIGRGHADVVRLLLDRGAHVTPAFLKDSIQLAAELAHGDVAEVLLAAGAPADEPSNAGPTPLQAAAYEGAEGVARALLAAGADANRVTSTGATPLLLAAQNGHVDTLRVLLEGGARVDYCDPAGLTALYLASQNGFLQAAKVLVEAGAAIAPQTQAERTPVEIAVANHHFRVVEFLEGRLATPPRLGVCEDQHLIIAPTQVSEPSNPQWMQWVAQNSESFRSSEELRDLPHHAGRPPGYHAVQFAPEMRFWLPKQRRHNAEEAANIAQILRELFVGIYVFDQVPCIRLFPEADSSAQPVTPPAYMQTFVGRVLTELAALLRGGLTGTWLPRDGRLELPRPIPRSPAARQRVYERMGAVDLWRTGTGSDALRAAALAWEERAVQGAIGTTHLHFDTTPGGIVQSAGHVLVSESKMHASLVSQPAARGKQVDMESVNDALAAALVEHIAGTWENQYVLHLAGVVAFFSGVMQYLLTQDLLPDLSQLEALPCLHRVELSLPPPIEPDARFLRGVGITGLAAPQPLSVLKATPSQARAIETGSFSADEYAEIPMSIVRMDSAAKLPKWLFDMRREAQMTRQSA